MRILVMSQGALDGQVAGNSIRALELARVLSEHGEVALAAVGSAPAEIEGLPVFGYHSQVPGTLNAALHDRDVVVATPPWPSLSARLQHSNARIVYDLYVPETIETLTGFPGASTWLRRTMSAFATDRMVDALRSGSGFVCASERQRDLLLGVLIAERLLDPMRVDDDAALRGLIDVVPFGLPAVPAVAQTDGARSAFGLAGEDEVVLWNGGLWPWLDAETAIRAVAELAQRRPRVRLVFMGAAHQVPAQRAAAATRAVAKDLGVLDRHVFYNEHWVPYERRADWLLNADCAISTHHDSLETRFAFRTRILDCFWARLPVVCTGGDDLGELIDRHGAGAVVPAGDVAAAAAAIETVLDRGKAAYRASLEALAAHYSWPRVAEPLVRMVAAPGVPLATSLRTRRPGHAARRSGYRVARAGLNTVGLRDWPRL